eukprot:Platyproteum_vivax@DN16660_c0_g1_i1.p1
MLQNSTASVIGWTFVCTLICTILYRVFAFGGRGHAHDNQARQESSQSNQAAESQKYQAPNKPWISICLNDAVIKWSSPKGNAEVIAEAVTPFLLLCEVAELFVFAQVETDEQEADIKRILTDIKSIEAGLKPHRIMFSGTHEGRASMIRQLQPMTHVETHRDTVSTLQGKVPNVVTLATPTNPEGDFPDLGSCVSVLTNLSC